jgi:hypothetical protein
VDVPTDDADSGYIDGLTGWRRTRYETSKGERYLYLPEHA